MNIISQILDKRIVTVVIISFVILLTFATSAMGAAKMVGSFGQEKTDAKIGLNSEVPKEETETKQGSPDQTESGPTTSDSSAKPSSPVRTTNTSNSSSTTPTNRVVLANNVAGTTTSPTTNSSACIITIFGKQYDVTSLRSTHSGGDVFVCGTDQTSAYQGAHGTSVTRLAPYLVTSGTQSSTTTTGGSTVTPGTVGGVSQGGTSIRSQSRHSEDESESEERDDSQNDSHQERDRD